jgi:hypothetical protein
LLEGTQHTQTSTTTTTVSVAAAIPSTWTTFNIALYWSLATADTGDVRWAVIADRAGVGESLNVSGSNNTVSSTAAGQYILVSAAVWSGVTASPTKLCNFRCQRLGSDGADTLAATASFIGLLLTRAS